MLTTTIILKHVNVWAKVNEFPYGNLHNMTPHDAYSSTIQVHTMNLADISHEQKDQDYNNSIMPKPLWDI